jgi:hypothetical protein
LSSLSRSSALSGTGAIVVERLMQITVSIHLCQVVGRDLILECAHIP